MKEKNNDENIEDDLCIPINPKDLKDEDIEKVAKKMAEEITEGGFPDVWVETKEELKSMSRKEACEEMFFAGAVEAFFAFMKQSIEEYPDNEDEFWEDGGFVKKVNPKDMQTKMRTFSMGHDEEMSFDCKICNVKISAHNNDWHEGLCDKCFDTKFNDGEVHIDGG